ncbi:MAG: hypothetical protein AB2A00_30335 [Myxococcota bacterium]
MSARLWVCALLLLSHGCTWYRARGAALDAWTLWREVRLAHVGESTLATLTFFAEEEFAPGVGELLYPDMPAHWHTRAGFDFRARTAWQQGTRGNERVLWEVTPEGFTARRDGETYHAPWGLGGGFHLEALMWLLHPWEAAAPDDVEALRLPRHGEMERLQLRYRQGTRDTFVLEVHPRTRLVHAVEYTVNALRLPVRCRMELSDHRTVPSGVVVPHVWDEFLLLPSGKVHFHRMHLWDVEATLKGP